MWKVLIHDRSDAGRKLAAKLSHLKNESPLILAILRGGVPIAAAIAKYLQTYFSLILVRKLCVPGQPELAIGAVSDGNHPRTVINWDVARSAKVSEPQIAEIAAREMAEIEHRRHLWLEGNAGPSISGRLVVVVDDGIATGASVRVALEAAKHAGAKRIVLAAPVAPRETAEMLRGLCDETVFLTTSDGFATVGEYYADFHQLEDREVQALMSKTKTRAAHPRSQLAASLRGPIATKGKASNRTAVLRPKWLRRDYQYGLTQDCPGAPTRLPIRWQSGRPCPS
jgi:putative phosphoribosyl transferase